MKLLDIEHSCSRERGNIGYKLVTQFTEQTGKPNA